MNKEINLKKHPSQGELSPLERGMTVINEIEAHISQKSKLYPRLIAVRMYINYLMNGS